VRRGHRRASSKFRLRLGTGCVWPIPRMARAFHARVTPEPGLHFSLRLIAAVAAAALSVVVVLVLAESGAGALAGSVSAAAA
jgi:hypothetical protein